MSEELSPCVIACPWQFTGILSETHVVGGDKLRREGQQRRFTDGKERGLAATWP